MYTPPKSDSVSKTCPLISQVTEGKPAAIRPETTSGCATAGALSVWQKLASRGSALLVQPLDTQIRKYSSSLFTIKSFFFTVGVWSQSKFIKRNVTGKQEWSKIYGKEHSKKSHGQ
jgi:hypothetical protein